MPACRTIRCQIYFSRKTFPKNKSDTFFAFFPGESIIIHTKSGKEKKVTLCRMESSQVKVGIEAPASVEIVRSELEAEKICPDSF